MKEIFNFYQTNFGDLVLLEDGKKTHQKWKKLTVEEAEEKLKQGLNIAVQWNGNGFADLDLDSFEALFFAQQLSNTNGWFNKKGRGHLIFKTEVNANKQFTFEGKVFFEVRAKGILTMMPPSIHPETKEELRWNKPLTLDSIQELEEKEFEKLLQKIYLCCLLSQYWHEGVRQGLAIRIGAFLLRHGFSLEEVEEMIVSICEYKGDKEVTQRIAGIRNTVKRLEELLPVVGLPSLKDLLPDEAIEKIYQIFNVKRSFSTFDLKKIEKAEKILKNENVLDFICSELSRSYYGRDKEKRLLYLLTQFRKINASAIAIISGESSVGKSSLVDVITRAVLEKDVLSYTYTSEKFFLYMPKELKNKILTIYELKGATALPFLKTFVTEHQSSLGTVAKQNGELKAVEVRKNTEGLVIFTTTTGTITDEELLNRSFFLTLEPYSDLQIIMLRKYQSKSCADFELLKVVDLLIKPKDVAIPFLDSIVEAFPKDKPRRLRDFDKFLNLIKAHALIHQYQRETTDGQVIATFEDLKTILDLSELIFESFSDLPKHLRDFLIWIGDSKPYEEALLYPHKSKKQVKRYIEKLLKFGYLEKDTINKTLTVVELPAVAKLKDIISDDVQMSALQKSLINQEVTVDNPRCPEASACPPDNSEIDKWTSLDKCTCPPSKQEKSTNSGVVDKKTLRLIYKDENNDTYKASSDKPLQGDTSINDCESSICESVIKIPYDFWENANFDELVIYEE